MDSNGDKLVFFSMYRQHDSTGVSGDGTIAYGMKAPAPSGKVVACWVTNPYRSVQIYDSMEHLKELHGHGGGTKIIQMDSIDVGGPK